MDVAEFKNLIWDYTRKINENANCAFNPFREQYGLTTLQVRILIELAHSESHTVGGLAERTCVAVTNISAMCKKLEAKGLLQRVRDQNDARVVKVALSEKGKEIATDIDEALNRKIQQYTSGEGKETFEDIIRGLQRLNDLLQKLSSAKK